MTTGTSLRVALVQMNAVVGDVDGNCSRILERLAVARGRGAQVIVFPEMILAGYPPEDLLFRRSFLDAVNQAAGRIAAASEDALVVVGSPWEADGIYNTALVCSQGLVVDRVEKQYLPNYGVFDEERYFRSGEATAVFHLGDWGIGVSICEDIWYPDGPYLEQVHNGANVLINISASPYSMGKALERERMLATRASDTATHLLWCNLVGAQDELVFDGGSRVFGPDGGIRARAPEFDEHILYYDLAMGPARHRRWLDPRWWRSRHHGPGDGVRHFVVEDLLAAAEVPVMAGEVAPVLSEEEELFDALVLGLGDYVRKNGFGDVVLGLSGGIDSSVTAAVAVAALGKERVHGVLLPSPITSAESRQDAVALAENLGVDWRELPIGELMRGFDGVLAASFRDHVPDVTEENLQARIRGVLLMALSNKFGWLVLSTGNKSELATGYSTLYGDMVGGFAVLKDVFKTDVFRLARWLNRRDTVVPANVLTKPPTAELREGQKDEDSLPPYATLDQILKGYVEQDRTAEELIAMGLPQDAVWRTIALVNKNEYKRRQAAVGVKVSPRAFGRDRRMPITMGFQR